MWENIREEDSAHGAPEDSQERSPMNVKSVGKPSPGSHSSRFIREPTQERNPVDAVNVEKPSAGSAGSVDLSELTQEKNSADAVCVWENLFPEGLPPCTPETSHGREAL